MAEVGLSDDVRGRVTEKAFALAEDDADEPVAIGANEKRWQADLILAKLAHEADLNGDTDLGRLLERFVRELAELIGPQV
jgi:hypothetical protein